MFQGTTADQISNFTSVNIYLNSMSSFYLFDKFALLAVLNLKILCICYSILILPKIFFEKTDFTMMGLK